MKNERGGIKLITFVSIMILIVLLSVGIMVLQRFLNKDSKTDDDENDDNENWKKISIGEGYYETTNIELDLNGDNIKEKINVIESGKYITINGKDYVANKYYNENNEDNKNNKFKFNEYNVNQYHFVDLNGDGLIEIIHRTFSNAISPITSKYTIYNYKDNHLNEIGSISIIGNIPEEIHVKGNTIKFEYWPYESPRDYTEEVTLKLKIDEIDENVIYSTVYYFALGSRSVKIYDNGDVYDDIEIEDPSHVPNYEYVKTLNSNQIERFKE